MATQSIKTRGSAWSYAELHDGWGDEATDEQAADLGRQVVEEFQAIAKARGSSAYWTPGAGEVIGDRDEELDPETLDEWREQATQSIWQKVIG